MRSLATDRYTHAQVDDAIRAGNVRFRRRYELLDRKLKPIGELGTVISGSGNHVIDADMKGSLTLKLWPDEQLRDAFLKRLVRPWVGIQMLAIDGGWAEKPMGAYTWGVQERTLDARGREQWDIVLEDQCWRLSLFGPRALGFQVTKNQVVTDVIKRIYGEILGYEDLSGIVDSSETIASTKWWIYQTPNTPAYGQRRDTISALDQVRRDIVAETDATARATLQSQEVLLTGQLAALDTTAPPTDETFVNWGQILSELQAGIGYTSPYFDWMGNPVAKPIPDLATTTPQIVYRTDERSILRNLKESPDFSQLANFIFCKASNTDGLYGIATSDANDLFPNHAFAEKNLGDFIDAAITDTTAGSPEALQAHSDAELATRMARHIKAAIAAGFNPAHEPYEVPGVQWTGDATYNDMQTFSQRGMDFDLDTFSMGFDLGLVVQ